MITINYIIPIYIRMTPEDLETELQQHCYIIDSNDDNNYVSYRFISYQTQTTIFDIADFKYLEDAVEYCKLKIDSFLTIYK